MLIHLLLVNKYEIKIIYCFITICSVKEITLYFYLAIVHIVLLIKIAINVYNYNDSDNNKIILSGIVICLSILWITEINKKSPVWRLMKIYECLFFNWVFGSETWIALILFLIKWWGKIKGKNYCIYFVGLFKKKILLNM